jgi:two-component system, LuxR family, response regulator FixJ
MTMSPHSTPTIAAPIIAIVDDDAAVRNSLQFSLEIEGFTVRTYSDPAEMLSSENRPAAACLIVDQNMPGMSGLNLLAALRRRGDRTPAILVSAHATAALRDEAADRGVSVVEKPFVGNALIDRIRAAITKDGG